LDTLKTVRATVVQPKERSVSSHRSLTNQSTFDG